MDPNIYPQPDLFDPYRFDDEIKKSRDGITYLPFGNGPRKCIGMRFALIEMKIVLATILVKFKFVKCNQTQLSLDCLLRLYFYIQFLFLGSYGHRSILI